MKSPIGLLLFFIWASCMFAQDSFEIGEKYALPTKGICAHRGATETCPENTLAAFEEAIRLGAQMIELDVQMTRDNQLVVMHDETVNRTTNGRGLVRDYALIEIKKLDAGKWKSRKFKGERVPTLMEALDMMPRNIWLNIHLKGGELLGAATAEAVMLAGRTHQVVIACEKESANGVRQVNPNIMMCNMERMSTRADYIDGTVENGFAFIQLKSSRDDENMLADIKRLTENGVRINYFHAEEESRVKELLDMGVDFILTDHVADMLAAYSKIN